MPACVSELKKEKTESPSIGPPSPSTRPAEPIDVLPLLAGSAGALLDLCIRCSGRGPRMRYRMRG